VDPTDLEILRRMYRGGRWSLWGADPRISVEGIARGIGMQRGAVAARIRKWRRDGFLLGVHASPSLHLFNCGALAVEFPFADSAEAPGIMGRLELVDGILSARAFCGDIEDDRAVNGMYVLMVDDHPRSVQRRMRLLREMFPSTHMSEPVPLEESHVPRTISSLDWKILGSMVEHPQLGLGDRAAMVSISGKTLARHLDELIESNCLDYDLLLDWTKSPTVALAIFYSRDDLEGILNAVRTRFRSFLFMDGANRPPSLRGPADGRWRFMWLVVPVGAPSEVHQIVDRLKAVPGVVDARPDFWGAERFFPEWYLQRISEKLDHS
jgi:DNA-binding Lrp family transcriptional regulator